MLLYKEALKAQKVLSKMYSKASKWLLFSNVVKNIIPIYSTIELKPLFAYSNLTLGICRSLWFLVSCLKIVDLSTNLWWWFHIPHSNWRRRENLHLATCNSIHPYTWHLLLASLPLFVITVFGIVWCWIEHSQWYHLSKDCFQRGLYRLVQFFTREGCSFGFLTYTHLPTGKMAPAILINRFYTLYLQNKNVLEVKWRTF